MSDKIPENPYASPTAAEEQLPGTVARDQEFQIASQGKRFLNLIIDSVIIQGLSFVGGFVLGIVYLAPRMAAGEIITEDEEAFLNLISMFIGLGLAVGYYVFTEAFFRRTFAKFVTGTIVVNVNGEPPSVGQVIGRSLARFIPFEAFSFLGGNQPVGWHDSLSGTRVINVR